MTFNAYTRVRTLKFKLTKQVLAIIFKLHVKFKLTKQVLAIIFKLYVLYGYSSDF